MDENLHMTDQGASGTGDGQASALAQVAQRTMATDLVPSPVAYSVITPTGHDPAVPFRLVLALHGGDGGDTFAPQMQRLAGFAWAMGALPPVAIAIPSSGRSFWVDTVDGRARWETFLLGPFLDGLRGDPSLGLDPSAAATALVGVSMGGLGVLRLAFKHPDRFAAVAALEPGIDPALAWPEVDPDATFLRSRELYERFFGSPVDEPYFEANNPPAIAKRNAAAITASGLQIYLECGDEDSLGLFAGAEFLHRLLYDEGVPHEYHLVRGADHLGGSLGRRFLEAFSFVGRVFEPDAPDPAVEQLRKWKARAERFPGLSRRIMTRAEQGGGRRRRRRPLDPG